MQKFEAAFVAANRWLLIVILAAMSLIVFANVVLRYTTGESLFWGEEVSRYLMIWLALLGMGPVLRSGGHIAIDNLQDSLPPAIARIVRVLVVLILVVFFLVMIRYGIDYVDRTMVQSAPSIQIPMGYVYLALPVGFALALIHLVFMVRNYVLERRFTAEAGFDADSASSL